MTGLAIDTSALIKLFVEEEEKGKEVVRGLLSLTRKARINLYASSLVLAELANILAWAKKEEKTLVDKTLFKLIKTRIIFSDLKLADLDKKLTERMFNYNLTAYDAIHLGVAVHNKVKLVTEDKQLLKIKDWCVSLDGLKLD